MSWFYHISYFYYQNVFFIRPNETHLQLLYCSTIGSLKTKKSARIRIRILGQSYKTAAIKKFDFYFVCELYLQGAIRLLYYICSRQWYYYNNSIEFTAEKVDLAMVKHAQKLTNFHLFFNWEYEFNNYLFFKLQIFLSLNEKYFIFKQQSVKKTVKL